jgi:hypothetical protein
MICKRVLSLITLFVLCALCKAQSTLKNNSTVLPKIDWSPTKTVVRAGGGFEGWTYVELNISRESYLNEGSGWVFGHGYYAGLTWAPQFLPVKDRDIFGIKAGYEYDIVVPCLAIEGKYQTDGRNSEAVITPKIGWGFTGKFHLFYGRNISLSGNPFQQMKHDQFSIIVNLSKWKF